MTRNTTAILIATASTLIGATSPTDAYAQRRPERSVTVAVGGLSYDFEGDGTTPLVAARADRRLSNVLLAEVGLSYARPDVTIVDHTSSEPVAREGTASVGGVTVGVQAEWPLSWARPYIGISTGLFGRVDHGRGGDSFVRTTTEVPVGVRVPVSNRVTVRTESRLRFDEHQSGASSLNAEVTVGLAFGF